MSISTRIDDGQISRLHITGEDVVLENMGLYWRLSSTLIPDRPPQVFELNSDEEPIECRKISNAGEYAVT